MSLYDDKPRFRGIRPTAPDEKPLQPHITPQKKYVRPTPAPHVAASPAQAHDAAPAQPATGDLLETVTGTLVLAGRWARLGAFLIDALILGAVGLPLNYLRNALVGTHTQTTTDIFSRTTTVQAPNQTALYWLLIGVGIAISLGYRLTLTALYGQTVGKRVAGIKVVQSDGSKPTFRTALIREGAVTAFGLPNLFFAFAPLVLIDLLDDGFVLFDRRKQALHDKIAQTFVVRAQPAV